MFTGIIEEQGVIRRISRGAQSASLLIAATKVLTDVKVGDSIAVNGVCLTVTSFGGDMFVADVMPETLRRSSLGVLNIGDVVNLERALRLGDRFGGHMVSGHIDGMGVIQSLKREDNAVWLYLSAADEILRYIILKGSVALDGVSLTVASLSRGVFGVSVIPHTGSETTLLQRKPGDKLNIECDLTGKYIERLISFPQKNDGKESDSRLTESFLKENGFI